MMISSAFQQDMGLEPKITKEKCGICCTPITARGVLDCCSDLFCFSCIDTWSAFTNLCPLCKLRFKFITFVPAADDGDTSDAETQEAFHDFLGQERVENWIEEEQDDGTLSFPSYFIDEDAVVCLDGDGCQVRKGLNESGGLGLEDISVACDSCDCWYHASCVGYNPDSQVERSWICPRCVGTGVLDLFKFQHASKTFNPKLTNKSSSLDKDGTFTYVDEGETAVVVSMDANFGIMPNGAMDPDLLEGVTTSMNNASSVNESRPETVVNFEKIPVGLTTDPTEKLMQEMIDLCKGLTQQDESALEENNDQKQFVSDKSLSTPKSMRQPFETCLKGPTAEMKSSLMSSPSNSPEVAILEVNDFPPFLSNQEEQNPYNMEMALAKPTGEDLNIVSNQSAVDVGKVLESMDVEPREKSDKAQEARIVSKELVSLNQENKPLKMQESPFVLPEKQQIERKNIKANDRRSVSTKSSNLRMIALQEAAWDPIPLGRAQRRGQGRPSMEEKAVKYSNKTPDTGLCSIPDAGHMQKVSEPKSEAMEELRELVEGPALCHQKVVLPRTNTTNAMNESSEGVRTRKIVYRGSLLDENLSRIVNEMRHCLKEEAVALGIVGGDRKLDVMDEKFFVAFKTAVQKSQACLRQLHLAPAKRMALQRPGAKLDGARKSLMKKLYGGSGKRRQSWDRDWDISFWKERVTHEKKSRLSSKALLQQEMANMEEAVQESKKMKKAEVDSLKSRVYLADTSLLPRPNDIKPLSEQSTGKTCSICPEKRTPLVQSKMAEGASKHKTDPEVSNASSTHGVQPLKDDKRKWALEVLARKTGQPDKVNKNKGSSLEDLPEHMRPVLEYDRRSKVPTATRQIQLDRFIEQYLQHVSVESVGDNSECRAALTAAMNKEKEIYERSNSKGVYVNLCVQALASLPTLAILATEEALQDGAVAESSSLSAMQTSDNEEMAVFMAWRAAGLISDSPLGSPRCTGEEAPVTDIDDVDANGRLELRSPDDIGNSSLESDPHSDRALPNPNCNSTETGIEDLFSNDLEIVRDQETFTQGISSNDNNKSIEKAPDDGKQDMQIVITEGKQDQETDSHQKPQQEVGCEQIDSDREGKLEETHVCDSNDQEGKLEETHPCGFNDVITAQEKPSAVIHDSSRDLNEDVGIKTSEKVEKISKKVEKYVKEHIRPLHKSHIITTEQYKWAVTKTTNKVMQHHLQAKSADFLIAEGEKVRRLAEQYLQIYSEHIFPGSH